jgi:putative transposase
MGMNDINSLSHTKWNCKYHIVFAPKYRRKVFYREKREAIGKILRQLCEWKGVKIIEAEACPDHIHLFVEIPPKMAVSTFMGYLKGKSSTMLYEQFGELKYKFRNREFWCRGYYVDTVGKNESRIAEYIKNQLNEDALGDQLRIPDTNPFTGSK